MREIIIWTISTIVAILVLFLKSRYYHYKIKQCNKILKDNFIPFQKGVIYVTTTIKHSSKVMIDGKEVGIINDKMPLSITAATPCKIRIDVSTITIDEQQLKEAPVFIHYFKYSKSKFLGLNKTMFLDYLHMING